MHTTTTHTLPLPHISAPNPSHSHTTTLIGRIETNHSLVAAPVVQNNKSFYSIFIDSIDNDDETPEQDAIDWIRHRIKLKGFDVSDNAVWTEEHEMTISDFLASPSISRLVVYNDKRVSLLILILYTVE